MVGWTTIHLLILKGVGWNSALHCNKIHPIPRVEYQMLNVHVRRWIGIVEQWMMLQWVWTHSTVDGVRDVLEIGNRRSPEYPSSSPLWSIGCFVYTSRKLVNGVYWKVLLFFGVRFLIRSRRLFGPIKWVWLRKTRVILNWKDLLAELSGINNLSDRRDVFRADFTGVLVGVDWLEYIWARLGVVSSLAIGLYYTHRTMWAGCAVWGGPKIPNIRDLPVMAPATGPRLSWYSLLSSVTDSRYSESILDVVIFKQIPRSGLGK